MSIELGRITQLTEQSAMDAATLLARIVALEKRVTDQALRLYALENRKPKGAQ